MSELNGKDEQRHNLQSEHLLDFLERAQTLFRGKWFVLLTITAGVAIPYNLFSFVRNWASVTSSGIAIATELVIMILPVIDLWTMIALIRQADERTLNARRRYCKFMLVVTIIGACAIGISIFSVFFLSTTAYDVLNKPPLQQYLLYMLPQLVMYVALLTYQSAMNGFYKNLYGQTQGLYIARAYARRARCSFICAQVLTLASPYLMAMLAKVLPAVAKTLNTNLVIQQPAAFGMETILSIVLTLIDIVATFLFFGEAESLERSA